jgi:hypothetical protein
MALPIFPETQRVTPFTRIRVYFANEVSVDGQVSPRRTFARRAPRITQLIDWPDIRLVSGTTFSTVWSWNGVPIARGETRLMAPLITRVQIPMDAPPGGWPQGRVDVKLDVDADYSTTTFFTIAEEQGPSRAQLDSAVLSLSDIAALGRAFELANDKDLEINQVNVSRIFRRDLPGNHIELIAVALADANDRTPSMEARDYVAEMHQGALPQSQTAPLVGIGAVRYTARSLQAQSGDEILSDVIAWQRGGAVALVAMSSTLPINSAEPPRLIQLQENKLAREFP